MLATLRRPFRTVVRSTLGLLAGALLLVGCDTSDPAQRSGIEVGFQTVSSASSSGTTAKATGDSLVIPGSNGDLVLDDIRLIVAGVELEGDAEGDDPEYEAPPSFLDLPLGQADVAVAAQDDLPPGTYNQLEFEVEDVEFDDADDDPEEEERRLRELYQEIQNEFPNWPEGASMVAVGTFRPDAGAEQPFATYFDAEIEIERELNPPVDVRGGDPSRTITVKLDPSRWFARSDGTVQNLAQRNYADTGDLVELEVEFEDGIAEIETGDDEDDDTGDDD
jgi:hypothetical protein